MLIVFRNELYFIFSFHFELKTVYLNQDGMEKNFSKFYNLAAKHDISFDSPSVMHSLVKRAILDID